MELKQKEHPNNNEFAEVQQKFGATENPKNEAIAKLLPYSLSNHAHVLQQMAIDLMSQHPLI